MTKEQLSSLKNMLIEQQADIAGLGLAGCKLLWSLKNGDGKIAAYSVLVLVPEREDDTTKAICEKLERKVRFQVEQEVEQHAEKPNEYYNYLQDLELDFENLSDKIVQQRMLEMYATFIQDRDSPLPEAPLRLCSGLDSDDHRTRSSL